MRKHSLSDRVSSSSTNPWMGHVLLISSSLSHGMQVQVSEPE